MSDKNGGTGHNRPLPKSSIEYKKEDESIGQEFGEPMAVIKEKTRQSSALAGENAHDLKGETLTLQRSLRSTLSTAERKTSNGQCAAHLLILPPCMFSEETRELLRNGPIEPPVTTETLQELDLLVIRNNISLRVDLNYDHDLHFMPISGRRGEEKRADAEQYFRCILLELAIYDHNARNSCATCESCASDRHCFPDRLYAMFNQLRNLLLMLVPEDDHQLILDNVDVDLLMQEVRHGIFDVGSFSRWLQSLLTCHCAPVRDDLAAGVAQTMTEAAADGDMPYLVDGLKQLFSFLECMRLDVANHQIRTFRGPLIEDGVKFQIDYFAARISQGRLNVSGSRNWFRALCESHPQPGHDSMLEGLSIFTRGLIRLCCDTDSALPITLKHDGSRLRVLQREIQDAIHLGACQEVFRRLLSGLVKRGHRQSTTSQLVSPRLMDLLDDDNECHIDQVHEIWSDSTEALSTEITHQAHQAVGLSSHTIRADMFSATTRNLAKIFQAEQQYHHIEEQLTQDLEARVGHRCDKFHSLTALEISEIQNRYQRQILIERSGATRFVPDKEDIARRLAHMAVIHWRVWRGLAYLDWDLCEEFGIDGEGVVQPPVIFGEDGIDENDLLALNYVRLDLEEDGEVDGANEEIGILAEEDDKKKDVEDDTPV